MKQIETREYGKDSFKAHNPENDYQQIESEAYRGVSKIVKPINKGLIFYILCFLELPTSNNQYNFSLSSSRILNTFALTTGLEEINTCAIDCFK